MFASKKGQGATEYLVLLAVVLVIALVSIALLGVFPSFATDTKINQSKTYWQAATPISIVDGRISSTSLQLIIRNSGSDTISINNGTAVLTSVGGAGDTITAIGSSTLGAGATTTVTFTGPNPSCTTGQLVENNIVFSYNTQSLTWINQTGSRPLALKCS